MIREQSWSFPPFCCDRINHCLWCDGQRIALRGKTFAVLRCLLEHAGQLVTKETLLNTVWPNISVGEAALTICISELRKALQDTTKTPRFIETVHRRGYRWIAPVDSGQRAVGSQEQSNVQRPESLTPYTLHPTPHLVGREREMADLRASLEKAVSGRGQLMLLVGEPGIGKTRTAEEGAVYARSRAVRVLTGRCYEGEGAPPFWPWVQIMRSYLADHGPEAVRAALGPGAAVIAQVIPDVQSHLPDLPTLPPLELQHARFRFFDSFVTFLKNLTKAQPLMLILDDLHWADTASLLLLQFVARELNDARLLVLGTYRDLNLAPPHPLAPVLGELARIAGSQSLFLQNLTDRDVARFIELTTGRAPASSLVAAVFQKTNGNPFFMTEVVHSLIRDGHVDQGEELNAESLPLPQRVRAAVERRLSGLSDLCRQVLTMAAVIGRHFEFSLLEAVENTASLAPQGDVLFKVLDESVAAGFVIPEVDGIGRYSFSHALVREILYATLNTERRVHLHRRVGEALERRWRVDAASFPAVPSGQALSELAFHFFQAAPGGDVNKAIAYAVQAGQRATAVFAYEEAARHYAQALRLMALQPSDEVRRCELLLALGEAQRRAGQTTAAKETFRTTAEAARSLRAQGEEQFSASLLARAALGFATGFGGVTATGGVEDTFIVALLEEARQALGAEDSMLRARVLGRLAVEIYYSRKPRRQAALSQEAVEIARRIGDASTLAYTLHARHVTLGDPKNAEERLAIATEMMRLATQGSDKELALRGHLLRLTDLLEIGDLPTADREIDVYAQRAEELRQPSYLWFLATWKATRAWLKGRFAEAERLAHEALAIGQRTQDPDVVHCFTVQIFGLRGDVKGLQGLELPVQDFAERYTTLPSWRSALALVYAGLGAKEEARRELEQFAGDDFMGIPRDGNWMITMTNLAQVCTILRDCQHAATLYQLLLPYAERCVIVHPALLCLGFVSRFLGLLALTLTRWEEAEAHFTAALQGNRQLKAPPLIALTQQQYAVMLLARKQPGDWDRAMALLDQSLLTAQKLGMDILAQRVSAIKDRHQTRIS